MDENTTQVLTIGILSIVIIAQQVMLWRYLLGRKDKDK